MSKVEENKKRKKTALLDTAYHLFTQNGYQKTSISDIVSQAGVAKGTFYLYFKDKTDIRYRLIAHRAGLIFKKAYRDLERAKIRLFEDKIVFLADNIIDQLYRNPTLLKLISKHLGWGIFKNAINEPMDGDYENIYEAYMNLMKESGREFEEPETMIYLIVELISGSCYNAILFGQPVTLEQLKPFLYKTIRSIIKNHQK